MYHSVSNGIYSNTGHCYHYQFKRRISHVHVLNLIREVTALRCDVWINSFKSNTTLPNMRLNYSRKFDLGSTFDLEVAFHMCQIQSINYRNPYSQWVKKFFRDWEYLQQKDLNSAPLYPTSESTAVFNYFLRLK